MNTQADERRLHIEALVKRLRRLYVEQEPGPGGEPITFKMLEQLCHHLMSEGYGE